MQGRFELLGLSFERRSRVPILWYMVGKVRHIEGNEQVVLADLVIL